MTKVGKTLTYTAIAAVISAASLVATVMPAAAFIACNREGECWHVRDRYEYRPEFGVVIHPDNWRWGRRDHFVWREHDGRGYWRGGVWIGF